MGAFAPVDNTRVIGGFARVLIAPSSYPRPTRIGEIIDLTGSPTSYAARLATYGWIDIGTTKNPSTKSMQTANAEWRGEQQGPIRTLYTDSTGAATFEMEEMLNIDALLQAVRGVVERGTDPSASEHEVLWVAPDSVGFSHIAFVRKDPDGRLHASVATRAQWDGSQLQETFSRGESEAISITNKVYADPSFLSPSGKPVIWQELYTD